MTIGLAFFLPIVALAIIAQFRKSPRPEWDNTPARHRQISHNGFKSRMGVK